LRGSVDGWDFKNYILGFLFYRFISEDLTAHLNATEEEAGNSGFNYATDVTDDEIDEEIRKSTIDEKGYFIYPSELFQNVAANAESNEDLNITLASIFKNIEGSAIGTASEQDMKGLFSDIDVNSPKLGGTTAKRNELLAKIMLNIGQMNLGGDLRDAQIDAFGDAYEYLMTMYASNAGKSGGEFFTPQEVAELLARIACDGKNRITKVYDPACGSGSLLLKFAKVLGEEKAKGVSFYGQELNITTFNLCRINMFLHHVPFNQFDIQLGDTLIEPQHLDEIPFDAIVSNPPYSTKWVGEDNPLLINDDRFSPAGILAPKTKADLAFTMHMLSHLSTTGTAAIVEFPGVLFRTGSEQTIRQYLIENNYIDCVIQLPANLFFGVGIATCIIVLKKSKSDNNVLFIDATEEFVKDGNKNKLIETNISNILSQFKNREDVPYRVKLVNNKEIVEKNKSNLSVSLYVEKEDRKEIIDINVVNSEIENILGQINSLNTFVNTKISQGKEIDALLKQLNCDANIQTMPLWKVTAWDKKFNAVDKAMQEKIIKYNYLLAKELDDIVDNTGDIRILYTTEQVAYTTAEKANGKISEGEIVAIPWGGNPTVKYYKGKFVTGDNRIATSLNTSFLDNKYLFYWMLSQLDVIKTFYRGAGIQHPSMLSVLTMEIPIPPLTMQKQIVEVLDSFTTLKSLIDKLSEQRQKQYEYYREKLLTFE